MATDAGILKQAAQGISPIVDDRAPFGEGIELRRVACHLTESLFKRVLRMIFPDQRRSDRHLQPPLVGYLGTLRSTRPYDVSDISLSGFCLLTDECWTPGTEMPITLQRTNLTDGSQPESFTVQATVVRSGADGVGFSIVLSEDESKAAYGNPLQVRWLSRQEMQQFLKDLKQQQPGENEVPGADPTGTSSHHQPEANLKAAFEGGH